MFGTLASPARERTVDSSTSTTTSRPCLCDKLSCQGPPPPELQAEPCIPFSTALLQLEQSHCGEVRMLQSENQRLQNLLSSPTSKTSNGTSSSSSIKEINTYLPDAPSIMQPNGYPSHALSNGIDENNGYSSIGSFEDCKLGEYWGLNPVGVSSLQVTLSMSVEAEPLDTGDVSFVTDEIAKTDSHVLFDEMDELAQEPENAMDRWERFAVDLMEFEEGNQTVIHDIWLLPADPEGRRSKRNDGLTQLVGAAHHSMFRSSSSSRACPTIVDITSQSIQTKAEISESQSALIRGMTIATDRLARSMSDLSMGEFAHRKKGVDFDGWVLHPSCRTRLLWDCLSIMICIYDIVMFPFFWLDLKLDTEKVDVCTSTFWTIDIGFSFLTGYFTQEGLAEMKMRNIAIRYAKSWMLLDICLMSLDWFIMWAGTLSADLGAFRTFKSILRFARLGRLARLLRLYPNLLTQMGRVNSAVALTGIKIGAYMSFIILMNHYVACAWFAVWHPLQDNQDLWRYTTALHWAIVHCTLGSMDVSPQNPSERLFACMQLLMSLVVFSTLLSSITDAATHLRTMRSDRFEQERKVRNYFSDHNIDPKLACRVWTYISRHRPSNHKRLRCKDVELFLGLPTELIQEIQHAALLPVLTKHPLLTLYNALDSETLKKICNSEKAIKQMSVLPSQTLDSPRRSSVECMIFVVSRELQYWPDEPQIDDDEHHPRHSIATSVTLPGSEQYVIPEGSWACEEALWARRPILSGPLVAGPKGCDLVFLMASEFQEIVRIQKHSVDVMATYARRFVNEFNAKSKDRQYRDVLFNEKVFIGNMANKCFMQHFETFDGLVADSWLTRASRATVTMRSSSKKPRASRP